MSRPPADVRAHAPLLTGQEVMAEAARIGEGPVDRRTEATGPEASAVLEQLASEAARLRALAEQLAAHLALAPEAATLIERLRESAAQLEALLAPRRA